MIVERLRQTSRPWRSMRRRSCSCLEDRTGQGLNAEPGVPERAIGHRELAQSVLRLIRGLAAGGHPRRGRGASSAGGRRPGELSRRLRGGRSIELARRRRRLRASLGRRALSWRWSFARCGHLTVSPRY